MIISIELGVDEPQEPPKMLRLPMHTPMLEKVSASETGHG